MSASSDHQIDCGTADDHYWIEGAPTRATEEVQPMPETDGQSTAPALIFRSQSGRTEVARRPDGTLHTTVLTGTDMFDWPEVERLVDAARVAGRKQAAEALAHKIRADLVDCDVYERLAPWRAEIEAQQPGWAEVLSEMDDAIGTHSACYWGEAAARIAEGR